jgi:hypothetical protein
MLQGILAQIQALDNTFRQKGSATWYRGQRTANWGLESKLHRYLKDLTSTLHTSPLDRDLLRQEEKGLYWRFKAAAWPLLDPAQRSDWGVVFTMQHYGFPTRLLDWTESFACALFWAQQHREPQDAAAVWVLDSEGLNEVSLGRRSMVALDDTVSKSNVNLHRWHPRWPAPPDDPGSIAVSPILMNPRMLAQRSAFTLMGDAFLPLEEQFDGHLVREGLLAKIELPSGIFDEVEDYLRLAGLGIFTYFPDLEGLALDHKARFKANLSGLKRFYPAEVKKDS